MHLEFYRDEAGDPRARAAAGGSPADQAAAALVGRYLESDIQGNVAQARELVQAIDHIKAGRLPAWSDTGNAHTLSLSADGATLESTADDAAHLHPVRLPLGDLRQAVAGWLAFLERPGSASA